MRCRKCPTAHPAQSRSSRRKTDRKRLDGGALAGDPGLAGARRRVLGAIADALVRAPLAFARSSNVETPILERLSAVALRRAIDAGLYRETA